MSVESTRDAMMRYFESNHTDTSLLAEDVVFTVMATGEEYRGREAVRQVLNYFYHIAFDAVAEPRNLVFAAQQCVGEWNFVGTHIGEFAGVPATGKSVRVPLCVVYDLEHDRIQRARIYFEIPAFLQQVGANPGV